MRLLALTLAALTASASPIVQEDAVLTPHIGRITVEADTHEDDGYRISIRSEKGSIKELVKQVGAKVGRTVRGFETIARDPKVDIYLNERPWREALRWSLGTAGLSFQTTVDSITVSEELPAYPSSEKAYLKASLTWQRVRAQYPEHINADQHQLALGKCAEALGPTFTTVAITNYETIVDSFPESDLIPEALRRTADLYAQLGQWKSAVLRYQDLAELPYQHPYHAIARRELSRSLCHIGEAEGNPTLRTENAQKALLQLTALDLAYPTIENEERRERALLQALAHTLTDDPIRALRTLDLAATFSSAGYQDLTLMEIRALALERAGRPGEASIAWLMQADQLIGEDRKQALIKAARNALASESEIATMTIVKLAKNEGLGRDLLPFDRTAQSRMGLVGELSALSIDQRITRGRGLLAESSFVEAARVISEVFDQRAQLKPEVLEQIAIDLARALSKDDRIDEAIDVLRTAGIELPAHYDRSAIYHTAADILENADRFEAAIDALGGRL